MELVEQKRILSAYLAPKRLHPLLIGFHVLWLLAGLAVAVLLGVQDGKHHAVLLGCSMILLAEGSLLRMWNGLAATSVMGIGLLMMCAWGVAGASEPWQFHLFTAMLVVLCLMLPFGIWRWHRVLRS